MSNSLFVVLKSGLYYRPNFAGYTPILTQAGTYSLEELAEHFPPEPEGMTFILAAEAPEMAPGASGSMQIDALKEEVESLKRKLEVAAAWQQETPDTGMTYLYFVSYMLNGVAGHGVVTLREPWSVETADYVADIISKNENNAAVAILSFNLIQTSHAVGTEGYLQ